MLKKSRNLVLALGLVLHILSPLAVQASESDWVWVETSPAQPAIPEQPAIEEVWELTEGRHVVMGNPGPDVFPFPEPQTIPGVVELILNNGWDPSTINEANLTAIFGYYIINQPYDVWEQLHWFPTAYAWAEWCMAVNDEQSGVGPCTSMTSGQVGQLGRYPWLNTHTSVPALCK